ncbi:MAG TPA: cytochrome b [Acetobacteraceae bacterium]
MNADPRPLSMVMPRGRYTRAAQLLHWVTAALMFTILPLAWVMVNMPETAPRRELLFTLHKSVGLTIITLVAVRLAWRATHPAPLLPGDLARWERAAAVASHWMLYVILIGMPVSGYLLDAAAGHEISYFGLFSLPLIPKSPAIAHAAIWTHVAVGQWLVYALVLTHVAATAWHVFVRRDGVLDRMLPEQGTPQIAGRHEGG